MWNLLQNGGRTRHKIVAEPVTVLSDIPFKTNKGSVKKLYYKSEITALNPNNAYWEIIDS